MALESAGSAREGTGLAGRIAAKMLYYVRKFDVRGAAAGIDALAAALVDYIQHALDTGEIGGGGGGGGDTIDRDIAVGESAALGDFVTVNSSGEIIVSSADDSGRMPADGVVVGIDAGVATVAVGSQLVSEFSGLTVGSTYYMGVNGGYVLAAGLGQDWIVQKVGRAVSATEMVISPEVVVVNE